MISKTSGIQLTLSCKKKFFLLLLLLCVSGGYILYIKMQHRTELLSIPYCFAERKALTERQLIDRLLFQDKADRLTLKEKKSLLKSRTGAEYPDCCLIGDLEQEWVTGEGYIPHYNVEIYSPRQAHQRGDDGQPYSSTVSIDNCGNYMGDSGRTIALEKYQNALIRAKKYWEGKK